ncbi:hypothetical protein ACP70R_005178 [Stipagrostis hirtigluma subsp. patula]
MGNDAKRRRTEAPPEDAPVRLSDDMITEILLRLSARSVLRFRAVCRAWLRVTTDPRFLAAHARLRPPEVVLYTYLDAPHDGNRPLGYAVDIALDAVPVSATDGDRASRRRRLIRYPKFVALSDPPERWYLDMPIHCLLLAACDGVLLFKKDEGFYLLCNPATRRWAELPRLARLDFADVDIERAFYFHRPSGEYRLLCRRGRSTPAGGTRWLILSTGAAEPRRVDTLAGAAMAPPCLLTTGTTPVPFRDHLHWPPRRGLSAGSEASPTMMVAFDTLSETFHLMAGPPTASSTLVKLFAMVGTLAAADFGEERHVDLWFLEGDYGAGRWERRHQVATPWGSGYWGGISSENRSLLYVAAAGDGDHGDVLLGTPHCLLVHNVRRRKTVRTVTSAAVPDLARSESSVAVSRHVFRESLEQHPAFSEWPSSAGRFPLLHDW